MEVVLRITLIYFFVLFGMQTMGKREFGQLSPTELITLLLIPDILTDALLGEDPSLTGGLIGVTTLFGLIFIVATVTHKFRRAENFIEGTPTVLVHRGNLLEDKLNKERINPGEIFAEMHREGLERLDQVKWAILEVDGKISIVPEGNLSGNKQEKA